MIIKTNRTLATRSSDFVNHSHDYRPNRSPLSPVTITNLRFSRHKRMEGNTGQTVIGSYHKVHYIEFACILSYRTWYAVMSYSVMLYCNRNDVLKAPHDSELNIHIRFTIIIIYEVPNCTNWKAAHHIAYFHLVRLERKLDMMLSGTT